MSRLGRSAGIALWLVLAPIAVDLAHPLFTTCDGPEDPAADHAHMMAAGHGWTSTHARVPSRSLPGCCGERPAAPGHQPISCCAHGGCFCCGGLAVAIPPLRFALPDALHRPVLPTVAALAGADRDALFRPPKA